MGANSQSPGPDAEREALRTDPALLARLIDAARRHKMTPAEVRAQRRGWVRSMTGATDEQMRELVPELFEQDEALATLAIRIERAEAEIARLRAENAGLREALKEAGLQIEYLHGKFKPTGSGNTILARISAALSSEPQAAADAE